MLATSFILLLFIKYYCPILVYPLSIIYTSTYIIRIFLKIKKMCSSPIESRFSFYNPNHHQYGKSFNDRLKYNNKHGIVYASKVHTISTLVEKRLQKTSGILRTHPGWMDQLDDEKSFKQWVNSSISDQKLSETELQYMMDELKCFKAMHVEKSGAYISAVDRVWYAELTSETDLLDKLKKEAADMENIPGFFQDWHPAGDNKKQILALVDPSLYPLNYNSSGIYSNGLASVEQSLDFETYGDFPQSISSWRKLFLSIQNKNSKDTPHHVPMASAWSASPNFSWLPAEFSISNDGTTKIESYINNLRPERHSNMYDLIAKVFSKTVPVFEQVITDAVYTSPPRIREGIVSYYTNPTPMPTDYNSIDYIEKLAQWRANGQYMAPEPEPHARFDRPIPPESLRNRTVQVVVKMHNIVLTPEHPEYCGDKEWYVEAMSNERIIATAVCCYDEQNVTQGMIAFRDRLHGKIEYVEDDKQSLNLDYGLFSNPRNNTEILRKEIGNVKISQGLCVGYPNLYQHKSSGFRLEDPTKPGYRKMLTFYLVDPSIKIPSTKFVPPQQKSWWADKVLKTKPFNAMPLIIQEYILGNVDFPISHKKALQLRRQTNEERIARNKHATNAYFEQEFVFNKSF